MVRVSMAAAAVTLAAALLVGTPWAYIAACIVIGLAVATLFPAAMHAATQIPGVRPAMGVATVGCWPGPASSWRPWLSAPWPSGSASPGG